VAGRAGHLERAAERLDAVAESDQSGPRTKTAMRPGTPEVPSWISWRSAASSAGPVTRGGGGRGRGRGGFGGVSR
jgi:hypothetical protein